MAQNDDEDELLRSVALQNAKSILQARQRAEDELVRAKEALEQKTSELAHSLAMMRATLESSTDGILVTDGAGRVTNFNQKYLAMWRLSPQIVDARDHQDLLAACGRQFADPLPFRSRIDEIYAASPPESYDLLELTDGRVFERFSRIQFVDERNVGRVWIFRDVTARRRAEDELKERVKLAALRAEIAGVLASSHGLQEILQRCAELLVRHLDVALARIWTLADSDEVLKLQGSAGLYTHRDGPHSCVRVGDLKIGWIAQECRPHVSNNVADDPRISDQEWARAEGMIAFAGYPLLVEGRCVGVIALFARRLLTPGVLADVATFADGIAQCIERKQADVALRASEARKTAIMETSLDSIITCDRCGFILEFNPAAEKTFGYRRADVIGRDMADVIVPARMRDRHRKGMTQYLATGDAPILNRRIEIPAVRCDGTEFPIELALTRISGEGPPLFTAYIRDITERRMAEEALHQQSEWLRVTLTSIGDAVITTDALGQVTFMNGVAEKLTGWPTADATGRPLPEVFRIVSEHTRLPVEDPALKALRDGTVVGLSNHTILIARDGTERPIDDSAAPMRDGAGKIVGAVLVFRDITERHRAESEMKETARQKDDFLALLAHELRNPLAPLRNGLEVMRLAKGDPVAVAHARAMMDRQLGHMVRLVDDLLDASRIGRNKMELRRSRLRLSEVIDHAVETARPAIDAAGHRLQISLPQEPLFLDADLTRLAQVVANLLTNSAKYTERGGQIWLTAEREGDAAVLAVRDTGIGIPAEALPRIFDMFSQVGRSIERATGGLGIGLALVKALTEMHGGTVTAQSDGPGMGSTFTLRLPVLTTIPESVESPLPQEMAAVAGARRRILVADDSRDGARTLAMLLTLRGNEVRTARDGIDALEVAEKFRPEVVFMDVGMPRLNGYDAARRIREQPWGRGAIIIALTGWGQAGDRTRSSEAGCDGHLVKPVNLADLENLLAELSSREMHRSQT